MVNCEAPTAGEILARTKSPVGPIRDKRANSVNDDPTTLFESLGNDGLRFRLM